MLHGNQTGVEVSLQLTDFGMKMVAAKHLREHPEASEEEVTARVREWLLDRPGAPDGDCPGRPWQWRNAS